jgi:hypothetical protein
VNLLIRIEEDGALAATGSTGGLPGDDRRACGDLNRGVASDERRL